MVQIKKEGNTIIRSKKEKKKSVLRSLGNKSAFLEKELKGTYFSLYEINFFSKHRQKNVHVKKPPWKTSD